MRSYSWKSRSSLVALGAGLVACGGQSSPAPLPGADPTTVTTVTDPVPSTPTAVPPAAPPPVAPPTAFTCADPAVPQAGASPMRRLTRLQHANSVNDLLDLKLNSAVMLAEDEKVGPFDSNLLSPVGELHVERYMQAAEAAADAALVNVATLLPCDPVAAGEAACAGMLVDTLGPRAFRRPLTPDERTQYLALYTDERAAGGVFVDGVRQVVRGFLQSPYFLYLVEAVPAAGMPAAVSPYEAASRLSFFLWNSMPDATLFAAAQANELGTAPLLAAQARRMLQSDKAAVTLRSFHTQWLGIDRLPRSGKDVKTFPDYTPALAEAMLAETTNFADAVIRKGDGKLASLFTLAQSPLEGPLFALYGVQSPANAVAGALVSLNPLERAGLLTQASTLAAHSHFANTSPVLTGVFVRANILCQSPPPPPPGVMTDPPPAVPGETTRQRFDRHRTDPTCANCHQLMDPIGYGFSNYDALGRYITTESGAPIDASGQIVSGGALDGPFTGAVELSAKLATADQVRECVMGQWFSYALGRNLQAEADGCSVLATKQAFTASDYNVAELLVSIVQSDSFRMRGVGGVP